MSFSTAQDLARDMVKCYDTTNTIHSAVSAFLAFHPEVSIEDAELLWHGMDAYLDTSKELNKTEL